MKNNFKWHKEQIGAKWFSVCDHEHVPMIEHTKDGKYKLRNANGKAVLHENYEDAVKLALEVWEKFKKLNRTWEGRAAKRNLGRKAAKLRRKNFCKRPATKT